MTRTAHQPWPRDGYRGNMGPFLRAFDWSRTSVGAIVAWPGYLRSAVDLALESPVPITLIWGHDGVLIYNWAFSRFVGAAHPALLGRAVMGMDTPYRDFAEGAIATVMAGEALSHRNLEFELRRNGEPERVWVNIDCSPVLDDEGVVAGILAIVVETTNAVLGERALRESQSRFRAVADLVPDLLWRGSPTGGVEWYNRRWHEYTGQEHDEALGDGWLDAIHPDDRETSRHVHETALATGVPLRHEHRICRHDGSFRWFLARATPVYDELGAIAQWFGAATDIHEQRAAREELEQRVAVATAELRALSHRLIEVQEEERRHIARELHDEIGQALTGLNLSLAMIRKQHSSHHLDLAESISRELLDRVRTLSLDLRPTSLDDLGIVPALASLIERYTTISGVRVNLHHSGVRDRLPPDIETTIYRVVQEALTNVARHARAQSATVEVHAGEQLSITIIDTGVGFDTRTAIIPGMSAGVAGMRERVELLGGELRVDSHPGGGTIIAARIPLRDPPGTGDEDVPS